MNFNNTNTAASGTTSTVTSHRFDNMKDVRLLKGDLYSYRGYIILSFLIWKWTNNVSYLLYLLRLQVGFDLIHLEVSTIESYYMLPIRTKMKLGIITIRQRKHTFYMHFENYLCFLIILSNPWRGKMTNIVMFCGKLSLIPLIYN